MGLGFWPLPPPRCQFPHCPTKITCASMLISGVHHHDFGFCARYNAVSGIGGSQRMMVRNSPHPRRRPMSYRW